MSHICVNKCSTKEAALRKEPHKCLGLTLNITYDSQNHEVKLNLAYTVRT